MKVRKMRLLRHKYHISRQELGLVCGISAQRVSELELETLCMTAATEEKLLRGFFEITQRRQAAVSSLSDDLRWHGDSLFEFVEESEYEL